MIINAGNEQSGAADNAEVDVGEGDCNLVEEEVEEGIQLVVGVAGEEHGMHVEDAPQGGAWDSEGVETARDGFQGGERGGAEFGVQAEGLLRIHFEGFKVAHLFVEYNAAVRGCRRIVVGRKLGVYRRREFHCRHVAWMRMMMLVTWRACGNTGGLFISRRCRFFPGLG